jgi:hypothetical protein
LSTSYEINDKPIEADVGIGEFKEITDNKEYDPKVFKAKQLANSFDQPLVCDYQPEVVTLALEGLGEATTEESIKKSCQGLHIVSISTEFDNLNGTCKGKSTISIRSKGPDDEKIQSLKAKLSKKGIKVTNHTQNNGLTSKYENISGVKWTDVKVKNRKPYSSARDMKLHNLESSPDISGHKSKWDSDWRKKSTRKPIDPELLENFKWQKTKNPKRET